MRKILVTICKIDGCDKPRHQRNSLCVTHCNQAYRNKPVIIPLHIQQGLPEGIVKVCRNHGNLTEDQVYRSPPSTRKYASCKPCRRESEKRLHQRNPHRKCNKRYYYLRGTKIKISKIEYEKTLAKQDGVCRLCKFAERMKSCLPRVWKRDKPFQRRMALDHKHGTEVLRGIICGKCNLMLGYAQDNPLILGEAIIYLSREKEDIIILDKVIEMLQNHSNKLKEASHESN